MSGDAPDGAALLDEARRTLLHGLLPLLPAERRYDGLMIANAMAIAAREFHRDHEAARVIEAALTDLADLPASDLATHLAKAIRSGEYDAPGQRRAAVRRYLRDVTIACVRISNPKLLGE